MSPHCPTQPHFNKLMRRKWLNSSEALDGIVGALGAKALALRRMQDEPYQVCMGEGWGGARRRGRGGEGGGARALGRERPFPGAVEGARRYRGVGRGAGRMGASARWSSEKEEGAVLGHLLGAGKRVVAG